MRLREIKNTIKTAIPLLELHITSRNSNPKTYDVTQLKLLQTGLGILKSIEIFDSYIIQLELQTFYKAGTPSIIIEEKEHRIISKLIADLKEVAQGMVAAISQTIDDNEENVISIKIPTPQNFSELETTFRQLNLIFSQTLLVDGIDGGIRIKNFDTGSYWVDIIASSKEVIAIIAGMTYSSVVIYKKLIEIQLLKEQTRELKLKNDSVVDLEEKSKELINATAQSEADYLNKEFFNTTDPEQIERIKLALKYLAELFLKGAEIHPSLKANNEVKETFPNFNKIESIVSKTNKIESKK